MPITDFLERNAKIYPNDVALVEINPDKQPSKDITWREYSLIETSQDAEKYALPSEVLCFIQHPARHRSPLHPYEP